jgi:hypothetical protein
MRWPGGRRGAALTSAGRQKFLDFHRLHVCLRHWQVLLTMQCAANGDDIDVTGGTVHGEFFVAWGVPVEQLIVTEGSLLIVKPNELFLVEHRLSPSGKFGMKAFFECRGALAWPHRGGIVKIRLCGSLEHFSRAERDLIKRGPQTWPWWRLIGRQTLSIKNPQTIIGLASLDLHSMGRAIRRFLSD